MFENIYRILTEILGESKQGGYCKTTDQYQFNCPSCAEDNGGEVDNKHNLEINLKLGKYHCWKCSEINGTKGNISKLVKKYGSYSLFKRYKEEVDSLIKANIYNIDMFADKKINKEETFITLPKTFKKIDLSCCKNKKLIDYLSKRKINQEIIDRFNIGFTNFDEKDTSLRNRIIIPSYDEFGYLNYWVGRDFTGFHKKMKYKNCTADKNEMIFQESHINWDYDIVLCEGAIDCLYLPINCVSMLGKTLTKNCKLYKELVNNANGKVIICLDADTDIRETKKIYNLLNVGRLRGKIWYVRLKNYKDFGEIYEKGQKYGIIKTLQRKEQFNEIDLLE